MGATSDNYEIVTGGITYTIASDYVNPFGGQTAHFQVFKIAHGANNTVNNVTTETPLPVGIVGGLGQYELITESGFYALNTFVSGITGQVGIRGVSGADPVGITVGTVVVSSTNLDIRTLNGGTVGDGTLGTDDYVRIQGICGGFPIGITTSDAIPVTVTSLSGFGIYGVSGATALGVTFGTVDVRGLTAASDSITVYGGGTAATVSVGLHGFDGSTAAPIHATSNALHVSIAQSTGITVSADNLDIRDMDYTTDTITVVGQGSADDAALATVPTYIAALTPSGLMRVGGTTGGWSGAALNVNVMNFEGISYEIVANVSSIVGITAGYDSAIPVQGSPTSDYGVWVVGDASGGPVIVQGNSGGLLPVQVSNLNDVTLQTEIINATVDSVKKNTDYLVAMKKALYANNISVSSQDFTDDGSLYTLVKNQVGDRLSAIEDTIVPANEAHTDQNSLAVNITKIKRVSSFISRTGFVGNTPLNLTSFNTSQGFTCEMGVRIKVSRLPIGINSSQNEVMCVMSEADAASGVSFSKSYVMYHGDEMFFEVDNIDKIKVFYPALSSDNTPNNTGSGMVFSFYAS